MPISVESDGIDISTWVFGIRSRVAFPWAMGAIHARSLGALGAYKPTCNVDYVVGQLTYPLALVTTTLLRSC